MRFFIAGIIQGSKIEFSIHRQNYRDEIKTALSKAFPDSEIYDPLAGNESSLSYTPEVGKSVFMTHNKLCGTEVDVLIAYLPEASMGTAIEIWEAWKNGAVVLTITPLAINWVVKFLSDAIYPNLDAFLEALASGRIRNLVENYRPRATKRSCDDFIISSNLPSENL